MCVTAVTEETNLDKSHIELYSCLRIVSPFIKGRQLDNTDEKGTAITGCISS